MSTITRERAQEIFLGNGPEPTASEERELARIALASLEAEAVTNEIVIPEPATHRNINEICPPGVNQTLFASGWNASRKSGMNSGRIPPIVKGIDAECVGWNAYRAAMLQGAETAESRCTIKTAPALDSLTKNAESRCGNSPAIPEGWVLVPEEPTHEMLEAGDEQFGTYDVYRRMIEAAPKLE